MSDEFRLPPPTFEFLVYSLKMQAEMQLGLYGKPDEGGPDLTGARHVIDMLGMLAEKTRGNLTMEEQRSIENSLTELRFRFVQVSQEAASKPAEAAAQEPEGDDPEGDAAKA